MELQFNMHCVLVDNDSSYYIHIFWQMSVIYCYQTVTGVILLAIK